MIDAVAAALRAVRCDLSNEKRAQLDIDAGLAAAGLNYKREVQLGPGEIIDFMVDGIGIEVKLKGQRKMAVYRQLCRYAAHERITALVLATNMSMGLPCEIGGKPVYYIHLARAWL